MTFGDYAAMPPPPMSAAGSRTVAAGLAVMLFSVSVGINFSAGRSIALLLCFAGVLVGVSVTVAGVRVADGLVPIVPAVLDAARGLAALIRRNLTVAGLIIASCAVTAVSGEAAPVLCFAMFALFLLGVYLINNGALGE